MGEVWEGRSRADGSQVAVKILRPELADNADLVARFVQERSILLGLSGPHLVKLRDLVLEGDTLAIVMEFVPGLDLRRYLLRDRTLRPALATQLGAQICEGLSVVHRAGVIHRDLKPDNVLLDLTDPAAPVAKVTDFGISRITYGPRLTQLTGLIGTPEYMAPEVAEQGPTTPAADLYSLGILLYELLAGRTPFGGGHPVAVLKRHIEAVPPPITGLPDELWTLIAQLLAKDPAARPSNAGIVTDHLLALSAKLVDLPALPVQEPPPGPTGATPAWLSPVPDEPVAETRLRQPNRGAEAASAGGGQPESAADPNDGEPSPQTQLRMPATTSTDRPVVLDRRRFWTRPAAKVGMLAALALVTTGVAIPVALTSGGHHAAASASPVSYSFDPQQYPDGLLVAQRWNLAGDGSHFEADLVASNSTDHALSTSFDLAIPKSLATSASRDITFTPNPRIITDDPVVAYDLNLAAHAQQNLSYTITTPAEGAKTARLQQWAADAAKIALPGPKATVIRLTSIKITPTSLPAMKVGKTTRLALTGTVGANQAAPAAALAGAAWTTSNPAVVSLTQTGQATTLTAKTPGTSVITAKVGDTQAHPLTVTVTAGASSPAAPIQGSISSPGQVLANGGGPTAIVPSSPPRPRATTPSTKPPTALAPSVPRITSLSAQNTLGSDYLQLQVEFCPPGLTNSACPAPSGAFAKNSTITTYACPADNCSVEQYAGIACVSNDGQPCYSWKDLDQTIKSWKVVVEFTANGLTRSASANSLPPAEVTNWASSQSGVVSVATCNIVNDASCNSGIPAQSPIAFLCASSTDCNSLNDPPPTQTNCSLGICWNWTGLHPATDYYVVVTARSRANPYVTSVTDGQFTSG